MLNVHLIPALGTRQLREITREELQGFLNRKLASGLSWKTVKHLRGGLTRVLGSAEEWGYIQHNPVLKTRLPRRAYSEPRSALAPEQVRKLAAELDEPVSSLALLLALTGLRVGELLALRWGNGDLRAQVLRVCETVYEGHFDKPKTKRSARVVPFGTQTAEIFAALRPEGLDANTLVFASKEGTPLDRRNLLKSYAKPAAKKMGLHVNWHLLRHSYATMLDGVGTPLGTTQSLGHAAPEITREYYLHAIPAEQRRAVESVERLVLGLNWTQVTDGESSAAERIN
jgi:integrase